MIRHVGFTGTQVGVTPQQLVSLLGVMTKLRHATLHHGDCVGADNQAHVIARELGMRVVLHPPDNDVKRAFCDFDECRLARPYLDRNRDIVNESDILVACPKEKDEQLRSGTWATIRYARRIKMPVLLVYHDGTKARQ